MPTGKIRVRLKAYDHKVLEDTCEKIVQAAIKTNWSGRRPHTSADASNNACSK